jgi:hypothetical protein
MSFYLTVSVRCRVPFFRHAWRHARLHERRQLFEHSLRHVNNDNSYRNKLIALVVTKLVITNFTLKRMP